MHCHCKSRRDANVMNPFIQLQGKAKYLRMFLCYMEVSKCFSMQTASAYRHETLMCFFLRQYCYNKDVTASPSAHPGVHGEVLGWLCTAWFAKRSQRSLCCPWTLGMQHIPHSICKDADEHQLGTVPPANSSQHYPQAVNEARFCFARDGGR